MATVLPLRDLIEQKKMKAFLGNTVGELEEFNHVRSGQVVSRSLRR
jgi:hypothetical protein